MLVGDLLLDLFPLHTEGRVGEHKVEVRPGQLVVREGVAQFDLGYVLAFIRLTGLAVGAGSGVSFRPVREAVDFSAVCWSEPAAPDNKPPRARVWARNV